MAERCQPVLNTPKRQALFCTIVEYTSMEHLQWLVQRLLLPHQHPTSPLQKQVLQKERMRLRTEMRIQKYLVFVSYVRMCNGAS